VAGGVAALHRAVEGAEDSQENAERDLRAIKLTGRDIVVGITASGTTPYVLAALKYARKCRATTVAITASDQIARCSWLSGVPSLSYSRMVQSIQTENQMAKAVARRMKGTVTTAVRRVRGG